MRKTFLTLVATNPSSDTGVWWTHGDPAALDSCSVGFVNVEANQAYACGSTIGVGDQVALHTAELKWALERWVATMEGRPLRPNDTFSMIAEGMDMEPSKENYLTADGKSLTPEGIAIVKQVIAGDIKYRGHGDGACTEVFPKGKNGPVIELQGSDNYSRILPERTVR